jgi:drug/metabolite transporter (DMT)-like permease
VADDASTDAHSFRSRILDPVVLGTLCGLASSILYTAANGFLRAVSHCDPVWVSAVKTLPTAFFMLPWMISMHRRGLRAVPPAKVLAVIALGGLVGQLGGNIPFQWALHIIGVALTVPLNLGGMIVFGTIIGRVFLHEQVTWRTVLAMLVLLVAVFVLFQGAEKAHDAVKVPHLAEQTSPYWELKLGVAAACLCGLAYAVLNAINRYYVTRGHSLPGALFTVSIVGMVVLGSLSWRRIGLSGMLATSPWELGVMLLAGVCNAAAFVTLTKSLQLTSLVFVNALNATQATMAAVMGVMLFQEPLSPWLMLGVGLTIGGLLLMRKRRLPKEPAIAEAQEEP